MSGGFDGLLGTGSPRPGGECNLKSQEWKWMLHRGGGGFDLGRLVWAGTGLQAGHPATQAPSKKTDSRVRGLAAMSPEELLEGCPAKGGKGWLE